MSIFMFLLCVVSVIKTSDSAINYNYISAPENMFTIPSESDSKRMLHCAAGICVYANSDIFQKIGLTRERFEAVYNEVVTRMAYLSLSVQNNLYNQKSHLDNRTRDIFWEEFHKRFGYDLEISDTCHTIATQHSLAHHRVILRSCWDPVQDILDNPPRKHLLIYRDVIHELIDLSSKAYKCNGDQCDELQMKLDDLNVPQKLKEIMSFLHSRLEKLVSADENFENCIAYDRTRQLYELSKRKRITDVLQCLEHNRHQNPSTINSSSINNVGVYRPPNAFLLLSAYSTKNTLQTTWRDFCKGSSRLSEERLDIVNKAVPDYVSQLINSFKWKNDTMLEYYKKRTDAEECFLPIEELHKQISRHDVRVSKCQLLAVINSHIIDNVTSVYDDLLDKVSRLDDAAFECRDDSCAGEIQKQLDDLEPEFNMLRSQLPMFTDEVLKKELDCNKCSNFYLTSQMYRGIVNQTFYDLTNCVDKKM